MIEETKPENDHAATELQKQAILLIKKLQEQVTFLERKIDTLLNQYKEREKSFDERVRQFSKPPFQSSYPRGTASHGGRYDGRNEGRASRASSNFPSGKSYGSSFPAGYVGKRKPFFAKRKERQSG